MVKNGRLSGVRFLACFGVLEGGRVRLKRLPSGKYFAQGNDCVWRSLAVVLLLSVCSAGHAQQVSSVNPASFIDSRVLTLTAAELAALSHGAVDAHAASNPVASVEAAKEEASKEESLKSDHLVVGHPLTHYLLTVFNAQGLQVAPLQIDEQLDTSAASDSSTKTGKQGVFDGNDELLFFTEDLQGARPQVSSDISETSPLLTWLAQNQLAVYELSVPLLASAAETFAQIEDGDQLRHGHDVARASANMGYAYLWVLRAAVPQSFQSVEDRVSYDVQTHFAETDYFSLAATLENPLVWQDVRFQGWPVSPGSFLDTLKIRLTGNTLANTSAITITNKNLRARVTGVRDGPLRASVDVQANMVLAGIPVMHWLIEMQFYPKSVALNLQSRTPPWVSLLLAETALGVSFDGVALAGARVRASGMPVEMGLVDGKRSAVEGLMAETGFAPDQKWWLLRHPEHLSLFAHMQVYTPQDTPISMIYEDDDQLKIAPERFAGQSPNIGFKIDRFPLKEPLAMQLWLKMDTPKHAFPVAHYLDYLNKRPQLQVRPRVFEFVNLPTQIPPISSEVAP